MSYIEILTSSTLYPGSQKKGNTTKSFAGLGYNGNTNKYGFPSSFISTTMEIPPRFLILHKLIS
ncbi:hypothetical protein D9V87_03825 [Bacteroidetes/Chlorobi group bacterium MS-B_bin-24]|nr:MAG: hypothetical protein D9V87_03825 [Bacteroidetes/Chlorobi group bacterium MS-B_bin-24]